MLGRLAKAFSKRARKKRGNLFLSYLEPKEGDRVLDLGSEDGSHLSSILPVDANVYVADISPESLKEAKEKYGYETVLIQEDGTIPFPDAYFDIVFCSSVIEHVTVDKKDLAKYRTNKEFSARAFARQREFADEVRRVAKKYFVQTPYRYFPIESHTWMPFVVVFIPRSWLLSLLEWTNRFWPKKTAADWHLLTRSQMKILFPDAEVVMERFAGLPKSMMAIRREG